MWNFLFLVLPPSLSEEEEGEERFVLKWPPFQILGPVCPDCFVSQPPTPTSTTSPQFHQHAFVVPFPFAKDGDQRASIVYCSSVMVWKQPSAEAFDICGHINQGCHTACLPSLPPNPTGSHPCPSPQPLLPPSSLPTSTSQPECVPPPAVVRIEA